MADHLPVAARRRPPSKIPPAIAALRAYGLTAIDISEISGLSNATVSRWMTEENTPKPDYLIAFASLATRLADHDLEQQEPGTQGHLRSLTAHGAIYALARCALRELADAPRDALEHGVMMGLVWFHHAIGSPNEWLHSYMAERGPTRVVDEANRWLARVA